MSANTPTPDRFETTLADMNRAERRAHQKTTFEDIERLRREIAENQRILDSLDEAEARRAERFQIQRDRDRENSFGWIELGIVVAGIIVVLLLAT